MDWEGAFLDLEGALLHSLPKSEGAMASLAPRFLRPWVDYIHYITQDRIYTTY